MPSKAVSALQGRKLSAVSAFQGSKCLHLQVPPLPITANRPDGARPEPMAPAASEPQAYKMRQRRWEVDVLAAAASGRLCRREADISPGGAPTGSGPAGPPYYGPTDPRSAGSRGRSGRGAPKRGDPGGVAGSLKKRRVRSLNPNTTVHTTLLDLNHHSHGDNWIPLLLYRSQIYHNVNYVYIC